VSRLWKHVERRGLLNVVAPGGENLQVPDQRCRIAGYINDFRNFHINDRLKQSFIAAFARRVDENDVKFEFAPFLDDLFGFSDFEKSILDAVQFGVPTSVDDRRLDEFDAKHLVGFAGGEKTDRTDAAIRVDDFFLARQSGIVDRLMEEFFRLDRVRLEKRPVTNEEIEVADGVDESISAMNDADGIDRQRRFVVGHRDRNRYDFGDFCDDLFNERIPVWQFIGGKMKQQRELFRLARFPDDR